MTSTIKHLAVIWLLAASVCHASGVIVVESVCGPNGCTPDYGAPAYLNPQKPVTPHPARCRVEVDDGINASGQREISWGSGTLLDAAGGLVITNNHVVAERKGKVICHFPNGQKFEARVGQCDAENDLAELRIIATNIETPQVDDNEPSGNLCAGGFGPDGIFRCYTGRYISTATNGATVIRGAARQGDSGGGVFNANRCWVGVIWGSVNGETYCTCGQPIKRFLDRVWPNRPGKVIAHADPPCIPPVPRDNPAPSPPTPPAANNPPITANIAASLAAIELRLSAIESKQGEPGPPGPKGDKGDKGEPGTAGDNAAFSFSIRVRNPRTGYTTPYAEVKNGGKVTINLDPLAASGAQ